MGEGKLRQSDISEPNLFGEVVKSAKALEDQLKETNTEINKSTKVIIKAANEADSMSQKGINNLIKMQKLMEANFKRSQTIDREKIKTSKLLRSAEQQKAAEDRRIAAEKRKIDKDREASSRRATADRKRAATEQDRNIKKLEKERNALIANNSAYKKLTNSVNKATMEFKELAAAHGVNSKQAQKAAVKLDRLDKELRGVNNRARDGRRDVGRYGLALNSVRGSALRMLGALGLLGGGLAIFRNAFNTVKDFEQGQADLASVLGVNVDQMKALTDQAKKLGSETTFTATQVSELQKSFAKLGFTQKEIENVTKATLLLAEATGTELGEAATVTGSTLRAFGLTSKDTQRVVDVMAKSFSSSSLDMQKFKVAMATVAPVAKAMGLSIEETTALIGTMTDSGVEASTAGAGLRNMMLDAKNAGLTLDEALEKIANSSDKVGTSFDLFGKRGATLGVILAENRDATDKLTDSLLDADGAAQQMAETQRNTLGGALKLLSSAWDGYILKTNEATGASGGLKDMVVFLADNLETIVDVLVKVIKFYALYRGALLALKLSNHIKEIRAQSKALKTAGVETKALSEKSVKLKGALKAIGWAAAIALVMEYVSAVRDAFDGTTRLKDKLDEINKAIGKHEAETNKRVENRQANLQKELTALEKSGLKGIELEEAKAAATKKASESIQKDIDMQMRNANRTAEAVKKAGKTLREYDGVVIKSAELAREQGTANATQIELLEKTVDPVAKLTAEYSGYKAAITILVAEMDTVNDITGDIIESTESNTGATEGHTEAIKEETKAYKDLTDAIIAADDAEQKRLGLVEDFAIEDVQIRLHTAIDAAKKEATEKGKVNTELINSLIEEEERLLRAQIERIFQSSLAEANSDEERELAATKRTQALIRLDEEFGGKKRKILDGLNNDQEVFEAKQAADRKKALDIELAAEKKHQDELIALRKKLFDKLDEFAQKALDKQIENSQKKQELLDKEISNSQKLEDRLRESAQNGNAIASESLAAQSDITEEKERQKIAEAKKEERIEELKALWNTLNTFLSQGDNPLVAGGKSIGVVAGFKQLFSGITGFFKGTKGRLKDEHKAQVSGRDGHIVRVDGDEAILTGDKMDRLAAAGLTSTNDIVNSAIMNQQLIGVPMANHIDDRVVGVNTSAMESKLDAILSATKKNKPSSMHPVFKRGLLNAIMEQDKKNGKVTRNWTYK